MDFDTLRKQVREQMDAERREELPNELESLWDAYMGDYDSDTGEHLRTVALASIAFSLRDIADQR